jgi:serine/threonine protein kinase
MNIFKNHNIDQLEFEDFKGKNEFLNNEFYKYQIQQEIVQNENGKNENNYLQDSQKHILGVLNSEYNLIKIIGSGASGAVYLSYSIYDTNIPKTLYAIKVIFKKDPNDNEIECEVSYVEKMNHKNIIKVYGHGFGILQTSPGFIQQVYYIIMEYIDHGSLLSQIGDNMGFGEDLGRLIFAQLLDGLEAIHNSNIVHRDIKIENIMLSGNDYTLKYVDFGFATEKSNGFLTSYLGTPNYAAPEIHLKRPYLGVYEDIFSLGVTLFITVTGYLPFFLPLPNDPLYHYIYDVDYISYWRNRRIKVSPSFMELFDNLIAFDPSQRPSISEIKNSKWMKEVNWELLPSLKQEFMKRETIFKLRMLFRKEKIMKKSLRNIGKINNDNNNNNYAYDNITNADQILLKIREKQKIDVVNDIRNQLFPINCIKENIKENYKSFNEIRNEDDTDDDNNKSCKKKYNQGFIYFKLDTKNLNSLMVLLKQFLRKEGYNLINKNLNKLSMELSNGEIDVLLSLEKILTEVKIKFTIENGNKEDFNEFKKIMKKFGSLKRK